MAPLLHVQCVALVQDGALFYTAAPLRWASVALSVLTLLMAMTRFWTGPMAPLQVEADEPSPRRDVVVRIISPTPKSRSRSPLSPKRLPSPEPRRSEAEREEGLVLVSEDHQILVWTAASVYAIADVLLRVLTIAWTTAATGWMAALILPAAWFLFCLAETWRLKLLRFERFSWTALGEACTLGCAELLAPHLVVKARTRASLVVDVVLPTTLFSMYTLMSVQSPFLPDALMDPIILQGVVLTLVSLVVLKFGAFDVLARARDVEGASWLEALHAAWSWLEAQAHLLAQTAPSEPSAAPVAEARPARKQRPMQRGSFHQRIAQLAGSEGKGRVKWTEML